MTKRRPPADEPAGVTDMEETFGKRTPMFTASNTTSPVETAEQSNAAQFDLGAYLFEKANLVAQAQLASLNEGIAIGRREASAQWIPISERLPEMYDTVAVYGNSMRATGFVSESGWHSHRDELHGVDITHWMPLPAAPSEKECT